MSWTLCFASLPLLSASRVNALAEVGPVGAWNPASLKSGGAKSRGLLDERLVWRRSGDFGGRGDVGFAALAADPDRGWLAVGGESGLSIGRPFQGSRTRSLSIRGVRDLRFGDRGELYIATSRGFWVLPSLASDRIQRPREFSPGTGEASRRVNRIATAPGFVALATDDGVWISQTWDPSHNPAKPTQQPKWTRLDAEFPSGPVSLAAVELGDASARLWTVVGSSLWRVGFSSEGTVSDLREVIVPGRPHAELPVDLVTNLPAQSVALVYPYSIYFRGREASSGRMAWEVARPVLPPGTRVTKLGHWRGRYWLATDRGLLLSDTLRGPWRRAGPPAGRAPAQTAAVLGGRLYVAGEGGLIYAEAQLGAGARATRSEERRAPSIVAVHRATLRQQGLETRVFEDAWRGVRRRGWLPAVGLRFGVDRDTGRNTDRDEIFVSGGHHELFDKDKDRSLDLGASITMTWDFRDLAYEPDQIELSRESRLVIGLRDDVLDEVNQLYFERLAILNDLAGLRDGSAIEQDASAEPTQLPGSGAQRIVALELRLEELTAGLDAWTGGWFSRQLELSPFP